MHLSFEENQNIVDALLIVNCQWLIVGSLPLTINYSNPRQICVQSLAAFWTHLK